MSNQLAHAVLPTWRTITWRPLIGASAALVLLAGIFRALNGGPGPLAWLGAATIGSAVVYGLYDPAGALLGALPTSRFLRRLVRLVLIATIATPAWLLVTAVLPATATGQAWTPALAMTASGVAVATWLRSESGVTAAAVIPLVWAALDQLLGGRVWLVGDAAALWRTDPWSVVAVGTAIILLGRNR